MKALSGPCAWLSIAILVVPVTGCLLNTSGTGRTVPRDTDLRGCFQHDFDSEVERGRIIIQQVNGDLLNGHGQGLSELGPAEADVWVFVGEINQVGPSPFAGVGELHPTWRTPAGVIERPALEVIRERISPTHDRLILQRSEVSGVARVELVRCP